MSTTFTYAGFLFEIDTTSTYWLGNRQSPLWICQELCNEHDGARFHGCTLRDLMEEVDNYLLSHVD